MSLLPYQQHVVTERAELEHKRAALAGWIANDDTWLYVDAAEKELMIKQHALMAQYIDILDQRIDRFYLSK